MSQDLKLFSPEFALEEINSKSKEIIQKTRITLDEFKELRFNLALAVEFTDIKEYEKHIKTALQISPDPNDVDFFALALEKKLPIWSNDAYLKKQKMINVFSTNDLLDKFYKILFPDFID